MTWRPKSHGISRHFSAFTASMLEALSTCWSLSAFKVSTFETFCLHVESSQFSKFQLWKPFVHIKIEQYLSYLSHIWEYMKENLSTCLLVQVFLQIGNIRNIYIIYIYYFPPKETSLYMCASRVTYTSTEHAEFFRQIVGFVRLIKHVFM